MAKPKKKNTVSSNWNKQSMTPLVHDFFKKRKGQLYNYKQIAAKLSVKDNYAKNLISDILMDMVKNADIEEVYTGKFRMKQRDSFVVGIVELTSSNNAFVHTDDAEEPVLVAQKNLNQAVHGDRVKLYLYAKREGRKLEGEVIEVLDRGKKTFVGVVEINRNYAFLIPETKSVAYDIFIPLEKLNGVQNGQKAIARITEWPAKAKNPFGEIIRVLGNPGENETEMHAILAEFELPYDFTDEVEKDAERIPDVISAEDIKARRDFRSIATFTIDPADAKDFDDALSYQVLKNGNIEVGVHIADVTHYVKPGSIVDEEGYNRATSVYLVDRVVPMLPEKLSNALCSLRPNEDKLCYSAVFEMDKNANVVNQWFGRTIINSDRRFSYEEAQKIIESGDGDMKEIILHLNELAQKMRKERITKGAFSFERSEVKFVIDEKGKPLSVYLKDNKESNQLIEEFMLLANKKVATFIGKEEGGRPARTFVYRIHDKPNEDKLTAFSQFIKKFGYKINTESNSKLSKSMNSLMTEAKGTGEYNIIENLALRAMSKAVYSTHNIGHYGLAFDFYSHFTSPIRRYPDMMVHRLLTRYLDGGSSVNEKEYEDYCKHTSDMERRAMEAERASIKYKQVEFMSDKVGQTFDGIISGITEWGIYVEMKSTGCEGMIPIRNMTGDFYTFDEKNYCLIGRQTGKKYQLGDSAKVQVARTNIPKRQIDLKLIEEALSDTATPLTWEQQDVIQAKPASKTDWHKGGAKEYKKRGPRKH